MICKIYAAVYLIVDQKGKIAWFRLMVTCGKVYDLFELSVPPIKSKTFKCLHILIFQNFLGLAADSLEKIKR